MHPVLLRGLIIGAVDVAVFVIVFFPLYFGGYVASAVWNANALRTTCTITDSWTVQDSCSYDCNCYQQCGSSGGSCHEVCQTCWKTCWDGWVTYTFVYQPDNTTHEFDYERDPGDDTAAMAANYLNMWYPVGQQVPCYVNRRDLNDVRFSEDNPMGFYYAALALGGAAMAVPVLWIAIEGILWLRENTWVWARGKEHVMRFFHRIPETNTSS